MQHEWVTTLAFQCVDDLYVTASAQRTSNNRLSFTTSEYCRTMNALQCAHFNVDWTHSLSVTTVDTWLTAKDALTYSRFLDRCKDFRDFTSAWCTLFASGELSNNLVTQSAQSILTLHLVCNLECSINLRTESCVDRISQSNVLSSWLPVPLRLSRFSSELVDCVDSNLHLLVSKQNCAKHLIF